MVAVCNNLAFGKVSEGSDVDLFVVAKTGRLFIVRSFITFLLQIFGVRRHGKNISGRFCLSFFVDEEKMNLSPIAIGYDIYLAYWIKSMVPLILESSSVIDELISKNQWARRYFDNENEFIIDKKNILKVSMGKKIARSFLKYILNGRFGDSLEKRLKKWQIKRAVKKKDNSGAYANLVIDDHILKFHNIDRRAEYRDRWFNKYGRSAKITDEKFLFL
jgi:hypothetical protein